jgi:c-di-GMP-binding flagellar brake protein YcgR
MFEGTVAWWRRMMKHQPAAASTGAVTTSVERRIWVRHPCNLQTKYAPETDELPLSARILDISRGGARLVVNRSHEPGSLISLELPGPDGKTKCAALACIVHERQIGDEEWELGCSFSRELDEEQLRVFGLGSATPPTDDKRNWPRFTANLTATVQLTNSYNASRWPAQVLDLSPGGIALAVDHEICNGALLTMDLGSANGHMVETILICVVHITTHEDGTRRLGCNFISELDENDLRQLLYS